MQSRHHIKAAVEGSIDVVVLKRIVEYAGGNLKMTDGGRGKDYIRKNINAWNNAARIEPWVVLRDLDHDAACAAMLRGALVPSPSCKMCFRVAVRSIEAWLLADPVRLAQYLNIEPRRVPLNPEALEHPKQKMVELAARSRFRDDMVPHSKFSQGKLYSFRLIQFVEDEVNGWRLAVAQEHSRSLQRCVAAVAYLVTNGRMSP